MLMKVSITVHLDILDKNFYVHQKWQLWLWFKVILLGWYVLYVIVYFDI